MMLLGVPTDWGESVAKRKSTKRKVSPARKASARRTKPGGRSPAKKPKTAAKTAKAAVAGINAWQDDPISGRSPIARPVPDPTKKLAYKIKGAAIPPGVYQVNTKEFRYWTASEALRRCSDYWSSLGVTKWQNGVGAALPISLDRGQDLNAYYDRSELAFFHGDAANGTTVFSCESPDVVCHEMGHAILDAHRPQLWDAPFIEVAAFHEFYGDASAILSALQLPEVVADASASLKANENSFVSRCAEQLGWAIRTIAPQAVDKDSLRNAWNKFKYVDPETLPSNAPATKLSSESHSFSRVFTGAFYEILSGMANKTSVTQAATDLGQLLLVAVGAAPIDPSYFAQVAAHMIDADAGKFAGKYRQVLTDTFVARKLLSSTAVAMAKSKGKGKAVGSLKLQLAMATRPAVATGARRIELDAGQFGLPGRLVVSAPVEQTAMGMAAMSMAHRMDTPDEYVDTAVSKFVEMLFERDRVAVTGGKNLSKRGMTASRDKRSHTTNLKTHTLVKVSGGHSLKRLGFMCGCADFRSSR